MASYKRRIPFDEGMPRHDPSRNHPSKYPHNSTASRESSKRQKILYSQYLIPTLEPTFDSNEGFPASTGNSEVQQMVPWAASAGETESSHQTAQSWSRFDLSEDPTDLERFFTETVLWYPQEPSIAVPVDNSGFGWSGLQSNSESLPYLSSPTNVINSNEDSYIDCHSGGEEGCSGAADSGTMNRSWEDIVPLFVPPSEIFPESFWADFQSSDTSFNINLGNSSQDAPFKAQTTERSIFTGYQDPNQITSSAANWDPDKVSTAPPYQAMDFNFRFDGLDDFPIFCPALPACSETALTPRLGAPSSKYSQLLSASSSKVSPTFVPRDPSKSPFTEAQQPRLMWESVSFDTFHGPDVNKGSVKTPENGIVAEELEWEHISSTEVKPHETFKNLKYPRKAARRQGPLNAETAKNAKEMRKTRSCLPCIIMKRKCTPGDICNPCSRSRGPSLVKIICTRAHLDDYTDLFFPAPFTSHLRPTAVRGLSDELNLGFVGIDVEVEFTCGCGHLPIKLIVSEFAPKSKLEYVPTIATKPIEGVPYFEYQYPSPIAVKNAEEDLTDRCRIHVEQVVKDQRQTSSPVIETGSKISNIMLEAVCKYHKSNPANRNTTLLDKAMMLHAIYSFIGTTLTITDTSKESVRERLRKPTIRTYNFDMIPRLLNRQIKSAMHELRQDIMREVLEELEKELKTRSKAAWATCFCVATLLCLCIEEAQISMDAFAMYTRLHGAESDVPTSEATIETCRKLDEFPFKHLLALFHGMFKTHQTSNQYNCNRICNPIRDKLEINAKEDIDQASADLAREVRKIIVEHKRYIVERAKRPSFGGEHYGLAQHMVFRERNSGRVVSTFLESFHST